MSLAVPHYIVEAAVDVQPMAYEWDDQDPGEAYLAHDERLRHKIKGTAEKGVVALSLGFAEWVAWRLGKDSENRVLLQFIEAVWAGLIDWRYINEYEIPDPEDWGGPIKGPQWAAFDLLADVVDLVSTNQFSSPESVFLSQLAQHVLTDPRPFRSWRMSCIRRLTKLYPRKTGDVLGPPIPRQALDPDFNYDLARAPILLSEFLRQLSFNENPYLASPERMRDAGFEGTPYNYEQRRA
jgi:hypothetical protein